MTAGVFQHARIKLIVGYIVYFSGLLAALILLFAVSYPAALALAAVLVGLYLLLLRPAGKRYGMDLAAATLKNAVGARLTAYDHDPAGGMEPACIDRAGLVEAQTERAFRSWERILGHSGALGVELADVSFAMRRNGLNAMFSGCCVRIDAPDIPAGGTLVRAGKLVDETALSGWKKNLLGELILVRPGSLYLTVEAGGLTALLDRRFLGFRVSPLLPVTEATLRADPLPELDALLRLAEGLNREGKPSG